MTKDDLLDLLDAQHKVMRQAVVEAFPLFVPPPVLYEGFGRNVTGGAGKPVYRVTSLMDSGPGSLREALSVGDRSIVFDVGGTINMAKDISVAGSNITLDGLTAPSLGITLKGHTLELRGGGNVILRGFRHRGTVAGDSKDGIRVYGAKGVVLDRLSVSDFADGAIDVTEKAADVLMLLCILGPGKSSHNFPNLIAYGAHRVSVYRNLYFGGTDRMPKVDGAAGASSPSAELVADVRNNLIAFYRQRATFVSGYGTANVVANYYIPSVGVNEGQSIQVRDGARAYVAGNVSSKGADINKVGTQPAEYPAPVPPWITDAKAAALHILANAGARGPNFDLDAADQDFIKQVQLP